jgi:glycosyltransferase involved in cell wall biosynthesis
MKICAISFKECWQDENGRWLTDGGFPMQMGAIASLFDDMDLLVVEAAYRKGGAELPAKARVAPMRPVPGSDLRRKIWLGLHASHYIHTIIRHVRRADAVHIPLPGDIPLLALLITAMLRKPMICRYGSAWEGSQTTQFQRLTKRCLRMLAGGRNVMLATGEGDGEPAPGMQWIFSTALSRQELDGIRPDLERGLAPVPKLAYIGRLAPEKGVANLVRAIGVLAREGFQVRPELLILGDGPERKRLEELARSEGCENIRFMGHLTREKLSRELLQADFCVHASLTEGMCKAWLDAMAHGLPVLASRVGAAPQVMGGEGVRGWLVPPGDVDALAAKLKEVLTGGIGWPDLRRRCRNYVEGRTLEDWGTQIGRICARQWKLALVDGRLLS